MIQVHFQLTKILFDSYSIIFNYQIIHMFHYFTQINLQLELQCMS